MHRRHFLAAAAGTTLSACSWPLPYRGPHRGIGLDPWRARPVQADFHRLRHTGATHVAIFPYGLMESHTTPEVRRFDEGHPWMDWSLGDDGIRAMVQMARRAGLHVTLLPTLADFVDGHWRGEVAMETERAWERWFASYRDFVGHYADLARETGAAGFSIGTELRGTVDRGDAWLDTIQAVRQRFGGWVTYAANWDDYDRVPWWSAVDFIGVQAYFELHAPPAGPPQRRDLEAAWEPIRVQLRAISERFDRKVLFTEVGYKSHEGATLRPWDWELTGSPAPDLQASAYEAAFRTFWNQPWFGGFYWWKWHPAAGLDRARPRDFTPQGKPALDILTQWYGGA